MSHSSAAREEAEMHIEFISASLGMLHVDADDPHPGLENVPLAAFESGWKAAESRYRPLIEAARAYREAALAGDEANWAGETMNEAVRTSQALMQTALTLDGHVEEDANA